MRIYEASGVLVPIRSAQNQYRHYTVNQIAIAKDIVILRLTGFSVREIKVLLPFRDQSDGGTLALLQQQLLKTEQTIATLSEQRNQLKNRITHAEKRKKHEKNGPSGLFAKRLVCKEVSEASERRPCGA